MKPVIITEVIEKEKLPERLQQLCEQHGADTFIRKSFVEVKASELKEGERAEITYVSTIDIDRDGEVLLPSGCILSEFRKAKQVLWGHDYRQPPIGSDQWIKTDSRGVLAKTIYAETERGEEIWQLVRQGHLKTSSVGFIPLKWVSKNDEGWAALIAREAKKGNNIDLEKCKRIYTKWLLLEHSKVSVPANINALTQSVAKGLLKLSPETLEELGMKAKYDCECLSCGHVVNTDKHCVDLKCPKCGGEMRRAERPGQGRDSEPEWLKNCSDEDWKDLEVSLKPYPNEHACRLQSPDKFSSFRRNNNRFGEGIHAIFGIRVVDDERVSKLQAIRFDKTKFTTTQARKWLKDHDHKCILFEPATEQGKAIIICEDCQTGKEQTIIEVVEDPAEKLKKETVKALNRAIGKV